jgi:hypothetical protein
MGHRDEGRRRGETRFPLAKLKRIKNANPGLRGRKLAREGRRLGLNTPDRTVANYEESGQL